jgi:hypothetical protein
MREGLEGKEAPGEGDDEPAAPQPPRAIEPPADEPPADRPPA